MTHTQSHIRKRTCGTLACLRTVNAHCGWVQKKYVCVCVCVCVSPQAEDPQLFARRVHEAQLSREESESQLRALFYLDALRPEVEEVVATYDFHAALGNAAIQVRHVLQSAIESR